MSRSGKYNRRSRHSIEGDALLAEVFCKVNDKFVALWISPKCNLINERYECIIGNAIANKKKYFYISNGSPNHYIKFDFFKYVASLLGVKIQSQIDKEVKALIENINPAFVYKDTKKFFYLPDWNY